MSGSRRVAVVLAACLLLTALLAADDRPDARRVAGLIAQLGSSRFAEREAASRALEALGPAALEGLRQALQSDDAEVRRRARQLVRKIESRLDTARLLEPQRIRVNYRELPLPDAVADLARKTGLDLRLEGDPAKLAERRITLDTGESTCWEALAQFGRKAGLIEALPPFDFRSEEMSRYDGGERRIVALPDERTVTSAVSDNRLVLKEGEARPLPVFQSGALRLRVLPPEAAGGAARGSGETVLSLDVRLAPPLLLEGVLALRIDRAIDERGQPVTQPVESVPLPGAFPGGWGEDIRITWDGVTEMPAGPFGSSRRVPVRLRPTDRDVKLLKELHGTLALEIQTATEPLVTVDQLPHAAGRSFPGRHGCSIRVADVQLREGGEVQVRIEVTPPPRELLLMTMPARISMLNWGRWWGGGGSAPMPAVSAANLSVRDADGESLPLKISEGRTVNGTAREFTLIFAADPGSGAPPRLLYSGRRTMPIEVPFTLKDVPLQPP